LDAQSTQLIRLEKCEGPLSSASGEASGLNMSTKAKTLLGVILLGVLDAVIPGLPIIALVLIYVILVKPSWFSDLVRKIYDQ
jgi:hypothetical protein